MFFLGRLKRWWIDRQRNIFRFWDGRAWRAGDPLALSVKLEELCPDYLGLLTTMFEEPAKLPAGPLRANLIAEQTKAMEQLLAATRDVFGVTELDPYTRDGLTRGETINVLGTFIAYMNLAAEDARPFGNSPGPDADSRPAYHTEPSSGAGGAEKPSETESPSPT